MNAALCEECRNFLRSNHTECWDPERNWLDSVRRFVNSLDNKRSVAQILSATNAGCRLCGAIMTKFKSVHSDLLSRAQANDQAVIFRLIILPYGNTKSQWEEHIDRPFLQVSISQLRIEYRLWRVKGGQTAKATSYDAYNTSSETSFARVAEWLSECMVRYKNCNDANVPEVWAPNRLIDLGSKSPFSGTIKLKQTKHWQTPLRYVAFSHCWGAMQPLRLLQSNLQALMDGN